MLSAGVLLGMAFVLRQPSCRSPKMRLAAGLCALAGALIGGRAAFVGIEWAYFQAHLIEIPQVWLGGLSGPGALLGGLAGLLAYAWRARRPLRRLGDDLLPLLAGVATLAWLGCWLTGTAYGPTAVWLGLPAPDEWGRVTIRWPLQPLAALGSLGSVWLAGWLAQKLAPWLGRPKGAADNAPLPGLASLLALFGQGLIIGSIARLRVDPAPALWLGVRPELWAAWALLAGSLLALFGLLVAYRQRLARALRQSLLSQMES
jgi:hypothetical protein